ncbi:MAG TPA: cytochrome d ubiquinol oxidase subunit II [Candidatus Saccharimonadales bacterium]|nr:cytochrome d ubiquinol oxidase subunit II [Candidatus Saccharimonadales bacterium]
MSVALLVIIFLLLGIYGWLSAVNCGVALLRLLPLSTLTRHGLKLFAPLWDVMTWLFLLAGLAALATIFHRGRLSIIETVMPSLLVGVVAIVLRFSLLAYMTQRASAPGLTVLNWIFMGVSTLIPLSFGAASVHLLTGKSFWQTPSGVLLTAMLVVGLSALMLSFVYYVIGQTPRGRLQFLARWLNIFLCVLGSVALVRVAVHNLPHLLTLSLVWFVGLLSFIIVLQVTAWLTRRERYMWWYLSGVAGVSPLLLMLANRPYLAYPTSTLASAYNGTTYGLAAVVGLAAGLLALVLLASWLAWQLLSGRRTGVGRRKTA